MSILDLSEQEIVRRNSLAEMRKMGIDPYPAAEYVVTGYTDEIKETFSDDAPVRHVSIHGAKRLSWKDSSVYQPR